MHQLRLVCLDVHQNVVTLQRGWYCAETKTYTFTTSLSSRVQAYLNQEVVGKNYHTIINLIHRVFHNAMRSRASGASGAR